MAAKLERDEFCKIKALFAMSFILRLVFTFSIINKMTRSSMYILQFNQTNKREKKIHAKVCLIIFSFGVII